MKNNNPLKRKLKLIEKAIKAGLVNEKDYSNLSARDLYKLQAKANMTKTDTELFFELSEAIKSNKLISFLSENLEDEENTITQTEATIPQKGM